MKKSGLTQGDRITGKVELWGVELSAIDCIAYLICTVKPRYTEVSGEASTIRYNETFGIARYLYITKLGLRSRNIRYNE